MRFVYQEAVEGAFPVTVSANSVYQEGVEIARNISQYYHVTGTLGNNRLDGRVTSCKRYASLCNPPQRGTLTLDTSFPRDNINPGERIVLYEQGVLVMTGWTTKVTRERPSHDWKIDFEDEYTRVTNTFITDELANDGPVSMKYMVGQVLDPTGISYKVSGQDYSIAPGSRLGLRSAHDALNEIMAYGSLYAWCDPDGTLRLKKRLGGRTPKMIVDPIGVQIGLGTETTRNDVHVYGAVLENGVLVNTAAHRELDGLIVDLKTVIANPLLSTYNDAQRVANTMLGELGALTRLVSIEIEGDPTIQIGTSGSFYHRESSGAISTGSGPITSYESTVDDSGYKMNVTLGERCPRIAGWTIPAQEIRGMWIAAIGSAPDPRIQKLIWTGDFGRGGQPTYNIVDIPTGSITGMTPTRDGSRVYLVMVTSPGVPDASARNFTIYYSDNPYDQSPEWVSLLVPGQNISGIWNFDAGYFFENSVTSMQTVGLSTYFVVRAIDSLSNIRFFQLEVPGNATGFTVTPYTFANSHNNSVGTKSVVSRTVSFPERYFFYDSGGNYLWESPHSLEFDTSLSNGVAINDQDGTGSWWVTDTANPLTDSVLYAGGGNRTIYNRGTSIYHTTDETVDGRQVHIRGDYWGSQYQFVDVAGKLFVGRYGSAPSFVYQWQALYPALVEYGVVVCIDKENPSRLAWFPKYNANANEVARISEDGGATWSNMTGNWWGTNGEVANRTRMQSAGAFDLIDAHPVFWSADAPT